MTSVDIAAGSVRSAAIMFDETDQGKEKVALHALLEEWGWQPFVAITTGPDAAERGIVGV